MVACLRKKNIKKQNKTLSHLFTPGGEGGWVNFRNLLRAVKALAQYKRKK